MKRLITIFLLIFISCGEPQNATIPQISDSPTTFSIENFKKINFKIGEQYDNSDLPKSNSVYWGFWKDRDADEGSARFQSLGGSVGGMRDFEIRFYDNHNDAIEFGKIYAEDSSGENAVLTKKNTLWPVGIKNRRTSGGPDGSPLPKYGGYTIYGNFIILCEGVNLDQSLKTCSKIINELLKN
tara:strand:- start:241 stop:789 length:549 start_codon:yes stop_codon:yes gene_type:complete